MTEPLDLRTGLADAGAAAELPQPIAIGQQVWPEGTPPRLSICCLTYNHARFIGECLDAFMRQETTFPVEIIVHDDASTDGTAEIVAACRERHPCLVRAILQSENQRSQGVPPLGSFVIPQARGRYIAICEGDDYWVDPRKLQKQVQFLDANPGYVICYHDAKIIDEDGRLLAASKCPPKLKRDLSAAELQKGAWTLTLTRCFRNVVRSFPDEYARVTNRDIFFTVLLGRHGAGKYLGDIEPAAYRAHPGGIWSGLSDEQKRVEMLNSLLHIYLYKHRTGGQQAALEYLAETVMPQARKAVRRIKPANRLPQKLARWLGRR
jgi:glycosyltransferase involved in cell wall biosynthesis